jgi:hypothetical protein
VWRAEADQVRSIILDTPERHVAIEPKRDAAGSYAVVAIENHAKSEPSDAGAPTKSTNQTKRFVSVDAAEKVREGLARFKALRTIGKVEANRAADFGLDKPEGTLVVDMTSGQRRLTIGSSTPGGGNYYVRDEQSQLVQVAVGEPIATLLYADSRMLERDLHGFKTDDVQRIGLRAGGRLRQFVRVANKPNHWADAANAAKEDETASNWLTKLSQLRVVTYEENFQTAPTPIVRVEYGDAKNNLGFVELFKVAGANDSSRYVVRSERSRWYAEVIKSQAEQLEHDTPLVVAQ